MRFLLPQARSGTGKGTKTPDYDLAMTMGGMSGGFAWIDTEGPANRMHARAAFPGGTFSFPGQATSN